MEQSQINCLVLDLDGTTLDADGKVSPRTQRALENAIAQGMYVVIASGRAYQTLPEDLMAIPGIAYAVTCNGASVYHVPTGKRVHGFFIPPEAVDQILQVTKELPVAYEAFVDGIAYTDWEYVKNPEKYAASQWTQAYIQKTRTIVPDMRIFLQENREQLESVELVVANSHLKEEVWNRLCKIIPEIYITSSEKTLVEVSHINCGKKAGMEYVLQKLNLTNEQAAAFGNGDNDSEMIAYAGLGVAVANATTACRKAAKLITGTNQEDGVAQVIEGLLKGNLSQQAYTYIVQCADGSLYTGWTYDLEGRMARHNTGKGAKYTKGRSPVNLAYYEAYLSKEAAMRREYQIKQLSRSEKLKLLQK